MQHKCHLLMALFVIVGLAVGSLAHAEIPGYANPEVPGRTISPQGAVPNPGTQQQEMFNITAPAEWNVFEFVVTCGACHAGTADQHTAHFGNWAGGNMASAARDPVFRANQIGVNNTVKAVGSILGAGDALDGAGNVCFRCHSPNGWLSGRFDPTLGGRPDGSNMLNSILLSTDTEGVMCETCHKAVGSVTYQRDDVKINANTGVLDRVWNLLAGIFDWEHEGKGFTDQAGDPTIKPGMPFGDTSLRFMEGLTAIGPYSGSTDVYFSDLPTGGSYTGQIYGIYPPGWPANWKNPVPAGQPQFNSAGQEIAYNKDGTVAPIFEMPVGVPMDSNGNYDYQAQSLSIEHPTVGSGGRKGALQPNGLLPKLPDGPGSTDTTKTASANEFIRTSEFCGSCHDLTVPILNHGMPEQRTFSEWKFSSFSKSSHSGYDPIKKQAWNGEQRCQDCHMPKLKHEYADDDTGTYNADPWLVGGFPYGKDRAVNGGTAIHKLTGANRDLPDMMKALYPEVDLEVIGIPTGRDPRIFPGMLSDRGPMWDRAKHNTEITLRDGVDLKIVKAPTEVVGQPGVYEMQVQVTNKTGHRLPTGYPDGRRIWVAVNVKDPASGTTVYESGVYDDAQATLNTAANVAFKRAQGNVIDATVADNNAVMVYERVTGTCTGTNGTAALGGIIFPDPAAGVPDKCSASPALTNNFILFDNRIPPKGFTYADYRQSGIKFWNYDAANMVPYEEGNPATPAVAQRYPDGQNFDVVTYRFTAAPGLALTASADLQWQTHTREFMEHLRDQDASTVRPQGPPNPADPMYPANPNYLSNSINGKPLSAIVALDGTALNDNWGGVAYAAWLETGKGAPFRVARDDSAVTAVPAAPANVVVRASGEIDPVTMVPDVFSAIISWDAVAGSDGYEVWVLYGKPDAANPAAPTATADWDRLAVVDGNTTSMIERVLNPNKTYGFKVVAFNGKGSSADSNVFSYTVGSALPRAPSMLTASSAAPGSTASSVTLTWMDNANNEAFFEVWRFPTIVNGMPSGQAAIFNRIISQTAGPVGGQAITGTNTWVDTDPALAPGTCYYYQVRSMTDAGDVSTWTTPLVQGCTVAGAPTINLSAAPSGGYRVDVTWTTNFTNAASYQLLRDGGLIATVTAKNYVDNTVVPATTYSYTVKALASDGTTVVAEATTSVTTPAVPVTPANVAAVATGAAVEVTWIHNGANADGFAVERSTVTNGTNSGYIPIPIAGIIVPPNQPNFNDAGVVELTTYQYRVKAVRQVAGDSPYAVSNQVTTGLFGPVSLQATVVTPAGPFVTSAYGNPNLALTWTDTSSAETGFELQYCTANCAANAAWKAGTTVGANAGTGTVNNLFTALPTATGARTVGIRVRAVSGAVTSAWATVTGIAVPARPGLPSLNNPTQQANTTKVSLVWSNVANEAGYVVERSADNGATWITIATPAVNVASYTDTTATGGITYLYRVTAVGKGGSATSATRSRAVAAAPDQPVITSATGSANGTSVTLTWGAATGATNYSVQYKLSTAANWSTPAKTTATARTISGLAAGNTYVFRVGSTNSVWTVPNYSAEQSVTLVPPAPATPSVSNTGTCASGATNCTQAVTFTVSTLATEWELHICAGSTATGGPCAATGAGWTGLATGTTTGSQSVTSGNLARGTTYVYRARANNAGGNSLWSGARSLAR